MSEPIPFDEHAERLKIRSSPKPVTRINRKVLMVGAGLGVLALFAAMSVALKPPTAIDPDARRELYNTTNTRKPEGLWPTAFGRSRRDHAARRTRARYRTGICDPVRG